MKMIDGVLKIQQGLAELGFDPGDLDGLTGPNTLRATHEAWEAGLAPKVAAASAEPPWITEARKTLGWHETTDRDKLAAYLKEDSKYLGDPDTLPWCGDWIETVFAKSLPGEPRPEAPFFAQNWGAFGVTTEPTAFCVGVIKWSATAGHVCFVLGRNGDNFVVLGANQSDRVSIIQIHKRNFIGFRWPKTFPARPINLPILTISGAAADFAATR